MHCIEPKELVHLFPLLQHMVAKASASIFVGTELAADDAVVETCKNIAIDIGSELGPSSYIMDAFPSLARLRMWYIGKYGKAINKHRQHLLHALGPVIDKRLAAAEKGGDWDRPVSPFTIIQVLNQYSYLVYYYSKIFFKISLKPSISLSTIQSATSFL